MDSSYSQKYMLVKRVWRSEPVYVSREFAMRKRARLPETTLRVWGGHGVNKHMRINRTPHRDPGIRVHLEIDPYWEI